MDSRWYLAGAWLVRLVLLGVLIQQIVVGDAVGATSMALFLALSYTYLLRRDKLPNAFDAMVSVAALLNALGFVFHLYRVIPLYDNVAHATTIFAVTLSFFFVVYRDTLTAAPTLAMATAVFTFGVTVGSLWEIVEWTAEVVLDTNVVFGLDDTVTDLITNTLAALAAGAIALTMGPRRQQTSVRRHPGDARQVQ